MDTFGTVKLLKFETAFLTVTSTTAKRMVMSKQSHAQIAKERDMSNGKKLTLINDIASKLESEGISLTPNAIRARLRNAMIQLANESCRALGAEVSDEDLERIAGSRAFQESIASMFNEEDTR
jgi:1,2-phenylacetyl-CoA epoxidase catalytic subunit